MSSITNNTSEEEQGIKICETYTNALAELQNESDKSNSKIMELMENALRAQVNLIHYTYALPDYEEKEKNLRVLKNKFNETYAAYQLIQINVLGAWSNVRLTRSSARNQQ